MLFTSPAFLFLFLPLSCCAFYLAARLGRTAAIVALLAASFIWYASWGWWPTALLFASITANFIIGYLLAGPTPLPDGRLRTGLYGLGQFANIGVLLWFKYQIIQAVTHGFVSPTTAFIFSSIPAGISFYTFHQAAFLGDAFNRDETVARLMARGTSVRGRLAAYARYATFVSIFPQLIIGPISYLREIYPQFERRTFGRLKLIDLEVGLTFISIGLFKKLALADNLDPVASPVFAAAQAGHPHGVVGAWAGALAYYLQLYFDFSGYSDMALGLARMFGLRYPINFYSPLKAVGIVDFYRRWHMTLTRVITRFVYTPLALGGTRASVRRGLPKPVARGLSVWLPLLLNFEIIALWHGAHWTFLLFGVLHGLWYVVETEVRGSRAFRAWRRASSERLRTLLGRVIFVVPMLLTFTLFRSDSIGGFARLLEAMAGGGTGSAIPVQRDGAMLIAAGLAIVYLLPNSVQLARRFQPGIYTYQQPRSDEKTLWLAWRPNLRWALYAGGLAVVAVYFTTRQAPFLYQGF